MDDMICVFANMGETRTYVISTKRKDVYTSQHLLQLCSVQSVSSVDPLCAHACGRGLARGWSLSLSNDGHVIRD